jgi:hypothetical protein
MATDGRSRKARSTRSESSGRSGSVSVTQSGPQPSGSEMESFKRGRKDIGLIDGYDPLDPMAPIGVRSRALEEPPDVLALGPLKKVYLIWMVGASCDGCTVAVSGGTHPRVEHLLAGIIPGLPRVELIHTVVSTEVGPEWTHNLFIDRRRRLLDGPR